MSGHPTNSLPTTVIVGEPTTGLIPTVTRIDTKLDIGLVSVVLAFSIVCILSTITIISNFIILAAFYRFKRLRTASNYLLVSLAISDLGVGVFMPFGIQLELSVLSENGVSTVCILPYSIAIALCTASVLVTVAIAVDRLTSLAQPLRYKNIITHSSIEKYIAVFWIYAIAVGLSPLIYARLLGPTQSQSGSCRFSTAILPAVKIFLFVAVWAPSAFVLLGCYMYVYLVARAHARAIYTVELSFRHQTQTLALPRYGQTLVVTVGAFFVLWLPFQTCMLIDIFCGTNILSEWSVVWLGLPILAHSGMNPWIYAFHHGEMRIAAGKIIEDFVALVGIMPSRYRCSPNRRGSNTNFELAEMNNSQESQRQPVEDCFAAKQHSIFHTSKKCLDPSDISRGMNETDNTSSSTNERGNIVEENIDDLTKMLEPKYIIDRNHVIDSNHNIDKINNLKYLLDPTFNKIRHLRLLNNKRISCKNFPKLFEPKFNSYQNLKTEGTTSCIKVINFNTMSDPILNAPSPSPTIRVEKLTFPSVNNEISSVSDPNIKSGLSTQTTNNQQHSYSIQNLDYRPMKNMYHRNPFYCKISRISRNQEQLVLCQTRKQLRMLKHSESVNTIGSSNQMKLSPPRPMNSEPPSPVTLESLQEEDTRIIDNTKLCKSRSSKLKQVERHSDPSIGILSHEFINPIELFDALLRNPDKSNDKTDIISRRPSSDSRRSESSRSQEILPTVVENLPSLPISHSINHFPNQQRH